MNHFECVFSTCVEVIPGLHLRYNAPRRILHVCGGDPYKLRQLQAIILVFSTCVEVILITAYDTSRHAGILHVCGGDPDPNGGDDGMLPYSPRVWR